MFERDKPIPAFATLLIMLLQMSFLSFAGEPNASSGSSFVPRKITLNEFLTRVAASNLDYAAQRYNVSIARAQIAAAKVSPNPTVNFGYVWDISGQDQPSTYTGGLSQTIEIGGKRGNRTAVANKNFLAAAATVDDFFRTLRGTAAAAFADAIASRMTVDQKKSSFAALDKLAATNEKRFAAGDIGQVDANQARVDALQAADDLHASESAAATAAIALVQLMGVPNSEVPSPVGTLRFRPRNFDLHSLLAGAFEKRPDVIAARQTVESTRASTRLARANRYPDVTVGFSVAHTTASTNPINPSPNFDSANLTLSVPVPVFNSFRGEYEAAVQTALQAEANLKSALLKVEVDVRQNYKRYELAEARLRQYQGGALELADKVLQAKLVSYQKGAATLLDVLTAQKADNDVHLAYITAMTERAKALIALEQAAATWDLANEQG